MALIEAHVQQQKLHVSEHCQ